MDFTNFVQQALISQHRSIPDRWCSS